MEAKKSLIPSLGEVHQGEIRAADLVARALLASNEPKSLISLRENWNGFYD